MVRFSIIFIYILFCLTTGCFGCYHSWLRLKLQVHLLGPNIPPVTTDTDITQGQKKNKIVIPDIEDVVKNYGYPIEKFTVTTKDGYQLTLFRVKHGKEGPDPTNSVRKPVMLQHGIMESSAVFLVPRNGLAYYLADKGYDVWIGNSRGTKLSKRHIDKDKDPDKEGTTFWDFSFHEMGVYDLPSVLETIQSNTEKQTIHYIGSSMGSTQFLVMSSEVPRKYLEMTDCVIFMGPVARPTHMNLASGFFFYLSWIVFHSWRNFSKGIVGVEKDETHAFVYKFCSSQGVKKEICRKIMENLQKSRTGVNLYDFDNTVDMYQYSPASVSANSFIHFLQIVNSGKFQQFDYGKKGNLDKYKSENPPEYNLKNIKKKLYLLVGGADDVAEEVDVRWLQSQLPSAELVTEKFKHFTHRDFHHSINIEENLYDTILKILTEWESKKEENST